MFSLPTLAFIFGAILLIVGVVGGGLKIREIEIPRVSSAGRVLAAFLGMAFIVLAFWKSGDLGEWGDPPAKPVALQSATSAPREPPALPPPSTAEPPAPDGQATAAPASRLPLPDQRFVPEPERATAFPSDSRPSFNCARATTQVEVAICGDARLARLDREMAGVFASVLGNAHGAERDQLRAQQRFWLSKRDECAAKRDPRRCIEEAYLARLAILRITR